MEVSVIIPAYNEERNIVPTLSETRDYLANKFGKAWEIIIVDDGSVDSTCALVENFLNEKKEDSGGIRLLRRGINMGKGAAVRSGMLEAGGRYRLFMDADNATRISELDKMLPFLYEGSQVVIGSRKLKDSQIIEKQPFLRRALSALHHLIVEIILGIRASDFNCGFKSFSAAAADTLFRMQKIDGWVFDAELLFLAHKNGIAVKEVAVEWRHKDTSKVKVMKDAIRSFKGIFKIRINDIRGSYNR